MITKISKKLSPNDIGITGGHQAGILVPKAEGILSFFPELGTSSKNPRVTLTIKDDEKQQWKFNFIYYNNKYFEGTRNEYRLTGMTKYLRSINAKVNDELVFSKDENGSIFIRIFRDEKISIPLNENILVLSGGWKIIKT